MNNFRARDEYSIVFKRVVSYFVVWGRTEINSYFFTSMTPQVIPIATWQIVIYHCIIWWFFEMDPSFSISIPIAKWYVIVHYFVVWRDFKMDSIIDTKHVVVGYDIVWRIFKADSIIAPIYMVVENDIIRRVQEFDSILVIRYVVAGNIAIVRIIKTYPCCWSPWHPSGSSSHCKTWYVYVICSHLKYMIGPIWSLNDRILRISRSWFNR